MADKSQWLGSGSNEFKFLAGASLKASGLRGLCLPRLPLNPSPAAVAGRKIPGTDPLLARTTLYRVRLGPLDPSGTSGKEVTCMEMNGDKPVTKKELQDELKGVHATMDRVAGDIRAEMVTKTELKEELKGVHATIDRVAGDIRAEMVTKTE